MQPAELERIVASGESETVEFKKSTAQLPRCGETLCAFLNGQGGRVFIGSTPDGRIVGQQVSDSTLRDLAAMLVRFEPPALVSQKRIQVSEGLEVLVLSVPAAADTGPYDRRSPGARTVDGPPEEGVEMSEYQYYEFAAIDGPVSDEGLRYARGCSSRAEVSRLSWRNVYHFGSFKGSEATLLKYYDAHFYLANWATARLVLALPEGCLIPEAIEPYLRGGVHYENTLTTKQLGDRRIVWFEHNEDGGWWDKQGEGILDRLLPIREDLIRGDHRSLFLAWLADFDPEEWSDPADAGVLMPPVPPGLNRLTPALTTFLEHFPVDQDARTVAAGLSQADARESIPIARVLDDMPKTEMRAHLERVAAGEGSRVMAELNRLTRPPKETPPGPTMDCTEFAARTLDARRARLEREAKAAEEKRKRKAEARKLHLASVMQRADAIWAMVDESVNRKTSASLDEAAARLKELRDAHEQEAASAEFQERLTAFRERYRRRPGMMSRIENL